MAGELTQVLQDKEFDNVSKQSGLRKAVQSSYFNTETFHKKPDKKVRQRP